MSKKYQVNQVNICPFKIMERGFKPMLNEYPTARLCVIDREEGFAIDVNHLRGTGTNSLSTVSVLSSTIGIMMQSKKLSRISFFLC